MPRGGARTVSGPPPDPNALRRGRPQDKAGWTTLPADGRTGLAPTWPLTEVQPREWELWCGLWSRPQAVMWERQEQDIEVALFVRTLAAAEEPGAKTELLKVVRQYLDSLGLSVQGMLRNRWRIAPSEAGAVQAGPEQEPGEGPAPRRPSARDRMKVVPFERSGA